MYNPIKTLFKGLKGFFIGLLAVIVAGIAQSVSDYKCDEGQLLCAIWVGLVPTITGALMALSNWLKHRK